MKISLKTIIKKLKAQEKRQDKIHKKVLSRANKTKQIGKVSVDSGSIFIGDSGCDPKWEERVLEEFNGDFCKDYKDGTIVASSGYGDGDYPVYATYNEEGRVARIEIVFIE